MRIDKSIVGIANLISLFIYIGMFLIMKRFPFNSAEIFYFFIGILIQGLDLIKIGNRYIFLDEIEKGKNFWLIPIIVGGVGVAELITQYMTMGNIHEPHQALMFIFSVILILQCNKYMNRLNHCARVYKEIASKITLAKVKIIALTSFCFLYFHWFSYERSNFSTYSLVVNMLFNWLVMVYLLIFFMYIVLYWKQVKDYEYIRKYTFRDIYPFDIERCAIALLIVWGSISLFVENFVIESAYYVIVFIVLSISIIYTAALTMMLKTKITKKDIYQIIIMGFIIMGVLIVVIYRVSQKPSTNTGNFGGIIISGLSLLSIVILSLFLAIEPPVEEEAVKGN